MVGWENQDNIMSVVVIKKIKPKQFELAADSQVTYGMTLDKSKVSKLWRVGDVIAGSVGKAALGGVFREYIENHRPKFNTEYGWINFMSEFIKYAQSLDSSFSMSDNDFLVAWGGRAYLLSGTYVKEIKTFEAIGAGDDYAKAAMHLGHSAREAVEVACELNIYCEKPIISFKSK